MQNVIWILWSSKDPTLLMLKIIYRFVQNCLRTIFIESYCLLHQVGWVGGVNVGSRQGQTEILRRELGYEGNRVAPEGRVNPRVG